MRRNAILCGVYLCVMACLPLCADALQDEMAIGRFIPSEEPQAQVVKFHFSRGKTFVTFYERMAESPYLFPIYDMILKGQLTLKPEIRDMNRDGYLDIIYQTTAETGALYYDAALKKIIRTDPQNLDEHEKKLTIDEELKLFDNGS